MTTAFLVTSSLSVQGQTTGVAISQITQQGQVVAYATVDTPTSLYGTLATYNGQYQLYLGDTLVVSGTAQGYSVVANFTFPVLPADDYLFTLIDSAAATNASFPFPVYVNYIIEPVLPTTPAQLHEGGNVQLNVTVEGGDPNKVYNAEVLVAPPTEIGENYTTTVSITTSALGAGSAVVTFPSSSFSPSGSSVNFIGTYNVYFNQSQSLAQNTFTIGFTDATQYHRGETVQVNAVGYQPSQVATVAITFDSTIIFSQSVTASSQGVIATTWAVPNNATVGNYSIAVTPLTTPSKTIADVQTFLVAGYQATFHAVNLADSSVPNLLIEAVDQSTSATYSGTTNSDGTATLNIEKGTYTVSAYWNQVRVSQSQVTISGNSTNTVNCQLTNLVITVQDKNGVVIPFVSLNMTFQYNPRTGGTQTGTLVGQTDVSGTYTFASVLPGISYTVAASKYGQVFNSGNQTISNLPAQASSHATIITPEVTLTLTTVDYNNNPISNARITLIEQASGVFYSVTTDSSGNGQAQVAFGQYSATVYTSDNVQINDTVINALTSSQVQLRNVLYNLDVSIKVVDYFGNPISGATVQISRNGLNTQQATTQSNGIATFDNVLGGHIEVTAYASGNSASYVSQNLYVDSPAATQLKMSQYVAFGGAVINASLLAAILIIVIAAVLLIILEVYRKVGFKLHRTKA
jgi:hypothetical protein